MLTRSVEYINITLIIYLKYTYYLFREPLTRECLHEDLHTTTQAEHQVQRGFLLDVVVTERASILQLLTGEDQSLLIRRNTLLVLDLGLDVVDGIWGRS
jgi:hypothetical protein